MEERKDMTTLPATQNESNESLPLHENNTFRLMRRIRKKEELLADLKTTQKCHPCPGVFRHHILLDNVVLVFCRKVLWGWYPSITFDASINGIFSA
jgi:hypothetical protein